MIKSNLVSLFKQLSKADRRALRKYVRSPWANQREDVVLLFDYLNEHIDGSPKNLERNMVFEAVFPLEKTFSMPALRYAQSFLMQVIKDFLVLNSLKEDSLLYETTLLSVLKNKGSSIFMEPQLKKTEEVFLGQELRSEAQFSILRDIKNNTLQQSIKNRQNAPHLMTEVIEAQTLQFICGTLKMALAKLSYEAHIKQQFDLPFLEKALELAQTSPWSNEPSIAIHYQLYQCLLHPSETESFYQLKKLLQTQLSVLSN